jgi:prepilin-type processing-associated H-X9-DG protein
LIELLVVIAIIAILAAILFPVFAQAREKARSTACLNNCKQIGTGLAMYLQDYDGMYPFSWFGEYGFDVALHPYIKNTGVWACPSNKLPPQTWPGYVKAGLGGLVRSYAMNGGVSTDQLRTPISESSITNPADTIMMLETTDTYKGTRGPDHETYIKTRNDVCYHVPFKIHQGGSNYVFCDGHAKWLRVESTWSMWRADHVELGGADNLCITKRQQ